MWVLRTVAGAMAWGFLLNSLCAGRIVVLCSNLAFATMPARTAVWVVEGLRLVFPAAFALPWAVTFGSRLRRARWARDEHKRCESCGYILDNLPEARCPECGEPFRRTGTSAAGAAERVNRLPAGRYAICVSIAVCAGIVVAFALGVSQITRYLWSKALFAPSSSWASRTFTLMLGMEGAVAAGLAALPALWLHGQLCRWMTIKKASPGKLNCTPVRRIGGV